MDAVDVMEAEARATAAKHVAIMLQRPDQLEKVEQYKRKVSRKKASVEAMLKTTMQSQLDGVKTSLNHLQTSLQDIKEIKHNLQEIEDSFKLIPRLSDKLQDVKKEAINHSQHVTAIENLKHIFNVPGSVQKTQAFINEGKLLHAHQRLSDLENSRDEILFEMSKLPQQSPTDSHTLKYYFSDVEKLSDNLGKQLWLVLRRTLDTVRKEPQVIVTALRIIEREETADKIALERQRNVGFLAPGRPKQWKRKAFEVLKDAVMERIEGNQLEVREENKMWLVRHLEINRMIILDDLKVLKVFCVPCFPPWYDIVNQYVKIYHNCISKHLHNIVLNGLEGNEYMTLLAWLKTYKSEELMGHPDLGIDVNKLEPLLEESLVEKLIQKFMDYMRTNYEEWMKNTLATEVKDWSRDAEPEADGNGYFHTSLPVILIQMIDQHLHLARTVNQDVVNRVMLESLRQVVSFRKMYRDAIKDYSYKHFEDRSVCKYYTHYMVAVANNCQQFKDMFKQLYNRYWKSSKDDNEAEKTHEILQYHYEDLRIETLGYLQDEVFLDLDKELADALTRKWQLTGTNMVDTICATLEDYCHDYTHLWPCNFDDIMKGIEKRIAKSYIRALLQRKTAFRNYEERKEVADKFSKEGEVLKALFIKLKSVVKEKEKNQQNTSPLDAFPQLAVVLKLYDTNMLSLEISSLIHSYPDISDDQLIELINLRGDLGKSDARQLVSEMLEGAKSSDIKNIKKTIFSEIYVA